MSERQNNREQQKLLDALAQGGRAPDLKLIRKCLAQRETLTPGLLQMLATDPFKAYDIGPDETDPRLYAPVHAGYLLIAYKETKAIPLFVEIFRDPRRADILIEWFMAGLHDYGAPAVDPLADLVEDEDAFTYGRAAATEVLSKIARLYPQTREHVAERLLAFLPQPHELSQIEDGDEVWTWAGTTLAELGVSEALPRMQALFEAGLADTDVVGDWEDYEGRFQDEPEEADPFNVLDTYRYLQWRSAQEAQAREQLQRRTSQEHVRRELGGPTVRAEPKVGRNDPCPCGSGKKYKHCHGRPGR